MFQEISREHDYRGLGTKARGRKRYIKCSEAVLQCGRNDSGPGAESGKRQTIRTMNWDSTGSSSSVGISLDNSSILDLIQTD